MEATEVKRWLNKIINQRKALLRMNKCKRNAALMASITDRLSKQLEAYNYDGDKIFAFVKKHYTDILLIIQGQGDKREKQNLQYLNQVALWYENLERKRKLLENTHTPHCPMQLQLLPA